MVVMLLLHECAGARHECRKLRRSSMATAQPTSERPFFLHAQVSTQLDEPATLLEKEKQQKHRNSKQDDWHQTGAAQAAQQAPPVTKRQDYEEEGERGRRGEDAGKLQTCVSTLSSRAACAAHL